MQTWTPPTEDPPSRDPDERPAPVEEPPPAPFAWFDPAPVTGWRLWGIIVVSALFAGVLIALEFGKAPWIVSLGLVIIWLTLTALAVLGMTIWDWGNRVLVKLAIGGFTLLIWSSWIL